MTRMARLLRRGLEIAFDLVLPRLCLGCSRRLTGGPAPLLLCVRCRGRLERVERWLVCRGCLRPLPAGTDPDPICLACRASPPPFARAIALWRYRPPIDAVLRALKYRGLDFLGPQLAREACTRLVHDEMRRFDLVAPVPLGPIRRLTRGFNQAERIARPLAAGLGLRFGQPLRRRSGGAHQAGSGRRQRQTNAACAFTVRSPSLVVGRRILLVDDVLTTGATARAAAATLGAAGAVAVVVLAVAATPSGGPSDRA